MRLILLCILFVVCVFLPHLFRIFEGMDEKNPNLLKNDAYSAEVDKLDKSGYNTTSEDGLLMATNDPNLKKI